MSGLEGKRCRICGSDDLYWYDGWLGYEAIKCGSCGEEYTDDNPL